MKSYVKPMMTVSTFANTDIITVSSVGLNVSTKYASNLGESTINFD